MSFLIYLNEGFEGGETFFYAEPKAEEENVEAGSANGTGNGNGNGNGNGTGEGGQGAKPRKNKFQKGDIVSAIWSGDDDWYEATILQVHLDEDGDVSYDVRFNDDDQVGARALQPCGCSAVLFRSRVCGLHLNVCGQRHTRIAVVLLPRPLP